jgi:hypothetical protein
MAGVTRRNTALSVSSEPKACGGQEDGGEIVSRELVEAGGDTSEVLRLVEEALDEVTRAVDVPIEETADASWFETGYGLQYRRIR